MAPTTAIRIRDVQLAYEEFHYRMPIKFGGAVVERVTLLHVTCEVSDAQGRSARGFGSMPLGNVWAFPSRCLTPDQTLAALKVLAEEVAALWRNSPDYGHPLDLAWEREPACRRAAAQVSQRLALAEPIPTLATLLVASPFDAALHDAFGKLHGRNCYQTYGADFVLHDLGHYLGPEFAGEYLPQYLRPAPAPRLALYHLIGALDPLTAAEVRQRVNDGLPETLEEWIAAEGLTHFKLKLNGDDLAWDVARIIAVERVTAAAQARRGVTHWYYSLDFNERCPNIDYLLEVLARVREQAPAAFARIQYIEQPTSRDLERQKETLHRAAALRPIVVDEALTDLASLQCARQLGYTGVALKACKGQTPSLLLAAAAQKYGMFLCVQDLTCPGASLVHSVGLAAHLPGVHAVEANARQYVPAANRGWDQRFPGLFHIQDGMMETGALTGPGLGAV
jgi:L-alanine-DL-glutamate epimerase-like enolase superfamily enzyme